MQSFAVLTFADKTKRRGWKLGGKKGKTGTYFFDNTDQKKAPMVAWACYGAGSNVHVAQVAAGEGSMLLYLWLLLLLLLISVANSF